MYRLCASHACHRTASVYLCAEGMKDGGGNEGNLWMEDDGQTVSPLAKNTTLAIRKSESEKNCHFNINTDLIKPHLCINIVIK